VLLGPECGEASPILDQTQRPEIVAIVAFFVGRAFEQVKRRRNLGHFRTLVGRDRDAGIKIVFPSNRDAKPDGDMQLENAVSMSLAEGAAIARLIQALRDVRPTASIRLAESHDFADDGRPFISVGGPSVNRVSAQLIERFCPGFQVDNSLHTATFEAVSYSAAVRLKNLTRDFGFILSGHTEKGTRFAVIFGITPFGANIAARAYIGLKTLSHEHRRLVAGHRMLFITSADVDGYGLAVFSVSNIRVVGVQDLAGIADRPRATSAPD